MEFDPLLLSRIQFAFTISFHIIFPAFTIGLASWLMVVEALWLKTHHPVYKEIYNYLMKMKKESKLALDKSKIFTDLLNEDETNLTNTYVSSGFTHKATFDGNVQGVVVQARINASSPFTLNLTIADFSFTSLYPWATS